MLSHDLQIRSASVRETSCKTRDGALDEGVIVRIILRSLRARGNVIRSRLNIHVTYFVDGRGRICTGILKLGSRKCTGRHAREEEREGVRAVLTKKKGCACSNLLDGWV